MKITICSLSALALICTTANFQPANAQRDNNTRRMDRISQQDDQRQNQRDQNQYDQRSQQQDSQQQDQQRQQEDRQQQQQHRAYRIDLDGWARIATDYDRDGRFDAVETIYLYDLENARKQSQARAEQAQNRRDSSQRSDQRRMSDQQRMQVSGTIQSLKEKSLMSSDEKKVVAKLKTDQDRTATVCLGKKSKVEQLQLQQGDQIRASGYRSRIDGKSVLLANYVSADGKTIQNDLPQQRGLQRYQGQVESTRKTTFRGRNGEFLIATVKTKDNGTKKVNLGPAREVADLDVTEGAQIKFLAREGKINGQHSLHAQVIRVNGKTADVREATERTLRDQSSRSQRDRSDKSQRDQSEKSRNQNGSQNDDRT